MKLGKNEIRSNSGSTVYQRGNDLYLRGKILSFKDTSHDKSVSLTGLVRGSNNEQYHCEIQLNLMPDDTLSIMDFDCECPASNSWYGMCKHCTALCIAFSERLKVKQEQSVPKVPVKYVRDSDSELRDILQRYSVQDADSTVLSPASLHIALEFKTSYYYYSYMKNIHVEIKVGAERLYVIKSIPAFIHSVLHGTQYQYGKKLSVCHSLELFDSFSQKVLHILFEAVREKEQTIDSQNHYYAGNNEREIALTNAQAAALMRLCMESEGSFLFDRTVYHCEDRNPPLTLTVRQTEGGAVLNFPTMTQICAEPSAVYLLDDTAFFCTEEFQKKVSPFLHGIGATVSSSSSAVEKFLSEKDFSRFASYVLPTVKPFITVDEGDLDFTPFLPQTPEFQFYLSGTDRQTILLLSKVGYGEAVFPLEVTGNEYRNVQAEKEVLDTVALYFPHTVTAELREASTEDEIYCILTTGLDRLRELGTVYTDESLHSLRFADTPATSVGVALHGDLIDIQVESDGYSPSEINAILDAYRLRKKYYRLKSGEFLSLTEGGLSVIAELASGIDLHFDKKGKSQTPAFRASYINSILDNDDAGVDVRRNAAFKSQIMALKNYRDEEYEIPSTLQARLRGYQKSGYRWLCSLSSCSLGGILADDMGLGKTVQILAYFLHTGGSFLVVCPASLIYNWESECKRFAPSIPCHVVRGTEAERKLALTHTEGLTITSYDQLRRDIALYQDKQFDCCVLDEAQYIRNAGTKAARSVKQIHALHRFALTGTPIENRLSDLWSIFDFLMPGYLFKYQEFKTRIEQPMVDGEDSAKRRLSLMSSPFILRRKKADVLKELPDKQETVVYVEMTDKQRELYDAQEQALKLTLQKASDAEYLHQKIAYLAALTRLRQICCTPELYLENYDGGSGKVDACIELLIDGAESGHRTLVFSQFTGMLELLIARATEAGLHWLYLSGKNTSEQRRDMVEKFQSGEYPVFFISLKAGGTGLNLTAADRVLHFDPWWNIAAEEQATDRTHRIGQKNKVFITKLVCKNTVEERILDLQNRKRALSDMVMDDESVRSASLDRAALLQLLQDETV